MGGPLGGVVADESVGVFVGSSLPGAVGVCENAFSPVLWVRRWWWAVSGPWSQVGVRVAWLQGSGCGG